MFLRLFSLFYPQPTLPPSDVDTIPCTAFDLATRELILTRGFVVNRHLDYEILRNSLFGLVETKFRKAGARLALRNGIYEYQVPRSFSADVPPIAFTHSCFDSPYASPTRPVIPHVPADLVIPSVHPRPDFMGYFRSSTCPETLSDCLKPNVPLIHVHVTTFEDMTFIGMTSTHIMFDAHGARTLLQAWTRVLNGGSTEIEKIPSMPWNFDPFSEMKQFKDKGRDPGQPRRGWHDPPFLGKVRFVMRLTWQQFIDPEEGKIICVPKKFLADRKAEVMSELVKKGSGEWVGSSDVLLAWWFKVVYAHRNDRTPVFIHLPINLRPLLLLNLFSNDTLPYINNAISAVPVPPLPACSFSSLPLRSLALCIRRAILSYLGEVDELRKDLAQLVSDPMKRLLPCSANGEYELLSNWRSANFNQLDFSGACVNEKEKHDGKTKVTFVIAYTTGSNGPKRGGGAIISEDDEAVWLSVYRGRKEWEAIRQAGEVAFVG